MQIASCDQRSRQRRLTRTVPGNQSVFHCVSCMTWSTRQRVFFSSCILSKFWRFSCTFCMQPTAFQLCQHHLLAHNLWSLTRKWASLTKWVLSNLTSPSCMATIYMNWKHYLLTRVFITWMVEGLHLDGTRSLQLTKASFEWGGAFKCKEKKNLRVHYL